ncbi:MAG: hypothetical protein D6820_00165 [Lentisphaerae bacterium]|nr:MAG: hypothetical protein D6820_00165 [Lentisphaerota bacterium]
MFGMINKKHPAFTSMMLLCMIAGVFAAVTLPFYVYDEPSKSGPWIPSGYMGETSAISMDLKCTESPKTGSYCIKVTYAKPDGWGGVVWQMPANDWGDQEGSVDLTGASKLKFWARGKEGGEKVKFEFGLIGPDKPFHDSAKGSTGTLVLTDSWQEYMIDLSGKDLSAIKTGFCWVLGGQGKPVTFYLDGIRYE